MTTAEKAFVNQIASPVSFSFMLGPWICPIILIFTDYWAVVLGALSAAWVRVQILPSIWNFPYLFKMDFLSVYFIFPLVWLALICYERLYQRKVDFWQGAGLMFKITAFSISLLIGFMYLAKHANEVSRAFIILSGILAFFHLVLFRFITKRILVALNLWQKPVLVLGIGEPALTVCRIYEKEPTLGYRVRGMIDLGITPVNEESIPVIGRSDRLEDVIAACGIQDVIIVTPGIAQDDANDLIYRIQPLVSRLVVVPDFSGIPMTNMEVETHFQQKLIYLRIRNNLSNPINRAFKRFFDIAVGIFGLILCLPIFCVISIFIRLESPGPVFFSHQRVGTRGRMFPCLKFRTMVRDAPKVLDEYLRESAAAREEWEENYKLKDDPRITRAGRFLRATSLDELPQLFNILIGDMSLVGPRPIIKEETAKYGDYIHDYYMVHPGLTGYWQINGRNDVSYGDRVMMDSWYVRNWSFWLDITILLKTFKVVLKRDGAY